MSSKIACARATHSKNKNHSNDDDGWLDKCEWMYFHYVCVLFEANLIVDCVHADRLNEKKTHQ